MVDINDHHEGIHYGQSTHLSTGSNHQTDLQGRGGGDPEDLIRIWDDGAWYYVVRNDDTQATVPVRDLAEDRRDRIAEALRRFQPIG